jgi:hypothetical protein
VKVYVVEAQLSDLSSSTSNKCEKFPPHKQKNAQKEVFRSDGCRMLQRVEFVFILSFITSKEID